MWVCSRNGAVWGKIPSIFFIIMLLGKWMKWKLRYPYPHSFLSKFAGNYPYLILVSIKQTITFSIMDNFYKYPLSLGPIPIATPGSCSREAWWSWPQAWAHREQLRDHRWSWLQVHIALPSLSPLVKVTN